MDDDYQYEQNNQIQYQSEQNDPVNQIPRQIQRGQSNDSNCHQFQNQKQYQICALQSIFKQLESILQEIYNLVWLGKGWCLLLLKQFKWDLDYLRENYYNDCQYYQKRIGFNPQVNGSCNRNVFGFCDVCCEEGPIYFNICQHGYCLDCWMGNIKGSISGGSPFLKCMDSSCPAPVLINILFSIFQFAGSQGQVWRKKYQKKLCQLFITTNRSYQFCTGTDCGFCIKINTINVKTVKCYCGKVFCFQCQSNDHYPCNCYQKAKWVEQVIKEEADAKWISANAKVCPWCNKAVQRSMGCNFMACTCGKSFCYMCSKPWQPDHKDHFKCHLYKKKPQQQLNRQKQIMQKMNHCTQRYLFNQATANVYRQFDVFAKRKNIYKTLNIELAETQFMESAYRFAADCCQKLKWIYAFTYFTDIKKYKQSFEFALGQFERYKQNLLKLLAVDLKKFMDHLQNQDKDKDKQNEKNKKKKIVVSIQVRIQQFKNLKKQIVNLYTCTKTYQQKFIQELDLTYNKIEQQNQKKQLQSFKSSSKINIQQNKQMLNQGLLHNLKQVVSSVLKTKKSKNKK